MIQRSAISHFPQRRQWSFSMELAVRDASAMPVMASAARIGVIVCGPISPTCVWTSRINRRQAFTPSMSRRAAKTANAITIPGYGFIAAHRETIPQRLYSPLDSVSNHSFDFRRRASDNILPRLWMLQFNEKFLKTYLRCALCSARKTPGVVNQPPSQYDVRGLNFKAQVN